MGVRGARTMLGGEVVLDEDGWDMVTICSVQQSEVDTVERAQLRVDKHNKNEVEMLHPPVHRRGDLEWCNLIFHRLLRPPETLSSACSPNLEHSDWSSLH